MQTVEKENIRMPFKPIFDSPSRPILIAGPCSAETEYQVLTIANQLAALGGVDAFRAGIWKPRTRPGSFEGVGSKGLDWLLKVKSEFGFKITTEIANQQQVREALDAGVDILWIGARTTVNPFSVQEIADALRGTDVPVMVKNPINPDLELWIGALERLYNAGITKVAAVHRGFSGQRKTEFRNVPIWEYPLELMLRFPDLQLINDPSHICGNRDLLQTVAQKAMDLNFDGIMLETHHDPDNAWSDSRQQVLPLRWREIINALILRTKTAGDQALRGDLEHLRKQIDELDYEIIQLLGERMKISDKIGAFKRANNISIFQSERWAEILHHSVSQGNNLGLSTEFISALLTAIHQESINHQANIMNAK